MRRKHGPRFDGPTQSIYARRPTHPEAAWQYVEFLRRFGEDAEVQSIAGEILDRVPGFGPARLERAKYFDREGQPDKAAEAARLVLQSAGNDLNDERAAHGILARSFTALGDTGNASREQAWIEAHPDSETRVNDIPNRPATFEQVIRHLGLTPSPVRKGEHGPLIYDQFTAGNWETMWKS